MGDQLDYAAFEARHTDPSVSMARPATALTGSEAAAYGREMLDREHALDAELAAALDQALATVDRGGVTPLRRRIRGGS
ncbi:hypothetical protein [Pseudoclavibacter sp. AY1H1]|uniref:hypothetical protein n=1 Tax=Pseudoclavibacter sp. AY1H1 TaxID=2080584 RepID=UPI000CE8FBD4|nr:hypothetical protein [Pseudoclavibacter sp. AY1H1]PPF32641.1 hypothetical protein C5E05_19240 [Pseudoclavibacter sp. AY1H1]